MKYMYVLSAFGYKKTSPTSYFDLLGNYYYYHSVFPTNMKATDMFIVATFYVINICYICDKYPPKKRERGIMH